MPKISAGLLMYRVRNTTLEVFLAHPGGPFFSKKDWGVWTIIKGEIDPNEDKFTAAQREFTEETGLTANGPFLPLGSIIQKSGKEVHAWAFENPHEPTIVTSNTFEIEWPPRSGIKESFPEINAAHFFPADIARRKINPAQIAFIDRLAEQLKIPQEHQSSQQSLF